jgi:hypothetical protein
MGQTPMNDGGARGVENDGTCVDAGELSLFNHHVASFTTPTTFSNAGTVHQAIRYGTGF